MRLKKAIEECRDAESTERVRVGDLPESIAEIMIERGHAEDSMMTPAHIAREWSAWELGCGSWASQILSVYFDSMSAASKTAA